jgi:hypothetical protein
MPDLEDVAVILTLTYEISTTPFPNLRFRCKENFLSWTLSNRIA